MKKYILISLVLLILSGCTKVEVTSLEDELLYSNKLVVGVSPDYPPFQSKIGRASCRERV